MPALDTRITILPKCTNEKCTNEHVVLTNAEFHQIDMMIDNVRYANLSILHYQHHVNCLCILQSFAIHNKVKFLCGPGNVLLFLRYRRDGDLRGERPTMKWTAARKAISDQAC